MSINFFEAVFPDVVFNQSDDTQVCCPFPHKAGNTEYYETRPSAGIDLQKNVFHCFSCGRSFSETSFCAEILGTEYEKAAKFLTCFHSAMPLKDWKFAEQNVEMNQPIKDLIYSLNISNKVRNELHLGYIGGGKDEIIIPIIVYGYIVDQVTYRPKQVPKYIRKQKSVSGIPCPYDLWKESPKDRATLICAGEKDMMIARSKGFNAISFTGGENNTPTMFLNEFSGREAYIVYDNDETGHMGAEKLALALKPIATKVYVVDLSKVCTEKGEDLWDYFCKYEKTRDDLIALLEQTPEFTEEDYTRVKDIVYPIINLADATNPKYINRTLRSNIQVIATIDAIYQAPTVITAVKGAASGDNDTLAANTTKAWYLEETNYKELFYMIDSNLKEKAIDDYIKTKLLGIPKDERNVTVKKDIKKPIYKGIVTNIIESFSEEAGIEFIAYAIDHKLENGKKYLATYKLIPHPQDGQKLIMVIKDVEETDDFLTNFVVTPEVIKSLEKFQAKSDSKQDISRQLESIVERTKGIVHANYDSLMLKVIDIWYHSVLQFNVGHFKNLRGYIDALIIGESRIGKSSTVAALQSVYGLGKIVSLAGTSATTAGLIGGSNKVAGGSYQTRAGLIPQNNKGALIFEELIKCRTDLIKELTDIRSSNKVRISRVNGSIELPAYVRMLTLTNSRNDGTPKPISSYPNGITLLTDIVGTPEDIARYDMIAIFGFEAPKNIDPFYEPPIPYDTVDYQNRIRWIWSRTAEQIYISATIYRYAVETANKLNEIYGSYINIFGIEAWQKIMRIAIAIAGYLCSADETYEQIVVKEGHIDEAAKLLIALYDNKTFKLREFVEDERNFNILTDEDKEVLKEVWNKNPTVLEYLFKNTQTNKVNLQMVSGLSNDDFSKIVHKLVKQNLIRIDKTSILITNKFTNGYNLIDKSVSLQTEVVFKLEDD